MLENYVLKIYNWDINKQLFRYENAKGKEKNKSL